MGRWGIALIIAAAVVVAIEPGVQVFTAGYWAGAAWAAGSVLWWLDNAD